MALLNYTKFRMRMRTSGQEIASPHSHPVIIPCNIFLPQKEVEKIKLGKDYDLQYGLLVQH